MSRHHGVFHYIPRVELAEHRGIYHYIPRNTGEFVAGHFAIFRDGFSRNIPESRSIPLYSATRWRGKSPVSRDIPLYSATRWHGTFRSSGVFHYIPRRIDWFGKQKTPARRVRRTGVTPMSIATSATLGQQAVGYGGNRADHPDCLSRISFPLTGVRLPCSRLFVSFRTSL